MAELTAERGASSVAVAAGGRLRAGTMSLAAGRRGAIRTPAVEPFGTMVNRNGIDISANPGSSVKVVQAGDGAYADAFAGFGRWSSSIMAAAYTLYGHLASTFEHLQGSLGPGRGQSVRSDGAGAGPPRSISRSASTVGRPIP